MDEVAQVINHFSLQLEDQNTKLDAVLEQLGDVPKIKDFRRVEDKVDSIVRHSGAVETVVKATNLK